MTRTEQHEAAGAAEVAAGVAGRVKWVGLGGGEEGAPAPALAAAALPGRAVQVDSIKTRVESAYRFSA